MRVYLTCMEGFSHREARVAVLLTLKTRDKNNVKYHVSPIATLKSLICFDHIKRTCVTLTFLVQEQNPDFAVNLVLS